jgi:hypothetical protein
MMARTNHTNPTRQRGSLSITRPRQAPRANIPAPRRGARSDTATDAHPGWRIGLVWSRAIRMSLVRASFQRRAPKIKNTEEPVPGYLKGIVPQVATLAFSFLAARTLLRSALAALASAVLAVLVKRSLRRTALPES